MSCNCCCTNTLDFCNQNICQDSEVDFDILAQETGVYKMITYFLGLQLIVSADISIGEKVIFPIDKLNESYEFTAEIYTPSGDRVVIRKNDIDYDCFKFKTIIGISLNPIEESS